MHSKEKLCVDCILLIVSTKRKKRVIPDLIILSCLSEEQNLEEYVATDMPSVYSVFDNRGR